MRRWLTTTRPGGSQTGGDDAYLSMLGQYTGADEEIEYADDEMEVPSASEAERGDAGTTTSGAEEGGPSGSEARKDRKRKKREPNKLGTTNMNSQRWTLKAVFLRSRKNMLKGTTSSLDASLGNGGESTTTI